MASRPSRSALVLAAWLALAGCAPASPSPAISSAAEAVRLVLEQRPDFTGIGPADPNLIGQAAWYRVTEVADGWQVQVRIGWGDCEAGCIHERRWVFAVGREGSVELVGEEGDELPRTP